MGRVRLLVGAGVHGAVGIVLVVVGRFVAALNGKDVPDEEGVGGESCEVDACVRGLREKLEPGSESRLTLRMLWASSKSSGSGGRLDRRPADRGAARESRGTLIDAMSRGIWACVVRAGSRMSCWTCLPLLTRSSSGDSFESVGGAEVGEEADIARGSLFHEEASSENAPRSESAGLVEGVWTASGLEE